MSLTPNINIRLAGPDDAAAIASLLADSFVEYKSLYTAGGYAATAISTEKIISRIAEGPLWVVTTDELILGTVSVVAKGDSLYIRGMAVHPTARRMRVGVALLQHVEHFARAEGFRRLFLSTTPFLDRAIRLYEQFAFLPTSEGPNDLFGTALFTMEKVLVAHNS